MKEERITDSRNPHIFKRKRCRMIFCRINDINEFFIFCMLDHVFFDIILKIILQLGNIVKSALLQPGTSHANKLAHLLHLSNSRRASVAHSTSQSTDELSEDDARSALVRNNTFNTFRNQSGEDVSLFRTLFTTSLGDVRADTSHTANDLDLPAVLDENMAGRFFGTCEHVAEHDGACAGAESFGDVATALDTTVSDEGNAVLARDLEALVDGGELGNARAGDDARDADRTGTDTDFEAVGSGFDEGFGSLTGGHVARDDVDLGGDGVGLESLDHVDADGRVAMSDVDNDEVGAGFDEGDSAINVTALDADGGADAETAEPVDVRVLHLGELADVARSHETDQSEGLIDDGEIADAVLEHQRLTVREWEIRILGGDEALARCHDVAGARVRSGELEVSARDDSEKSAVRRDDHQTAHTAFAAVPVHGLNEFFALGINTDGDGILDVVRLSTLNLSDHLALLFDGAEAVEDADSSFASDGDGHVLLADGVHVAGDNWDVQGDVLGDFGFGRDVLARTDGRVLRNDENIIEGQTLNDGTDVGHISIGMIFEFFFFKYILVCVIWFFIANTF